jgi:hypothetical protein
MLFHRLLGSPGLDSVRAASRAPGRKGSERAERAERAERWSVVWEGQGRNVVVRGLDPGRADQPATGVGAESGRTTSYQVNALRLLRQSR